MRTITTTCCVVGGGPAGMVLGLLLARAGVEVTVLEKHADFLRDFRGDTIHPSSLEVLRELDLLDDFLRLPHQKAHQIVGRIAGREVVVADFGHLPVAAPYIAFIPQWDFLEFLTGEAERYPGFRLLRRTEAVDLTTDGERVTGVRATDPDGPVEVHADLVVAADGRNSVLRERAGLPLVELGAPIDVLWFRISREASDPEAPGGAFERGRIMIMINRTTNWQCAWVIPKGSFDEVKRRGLAWFRAAVADLGPFLASRVDEIRDWDDVKLLTVRVDRLRRWYRPGLLCIGDAAHAMSPVGGIGINLAIQDAVAAANRLAAPLRERRLSAGDLRAVQRRRYVPTRLTQRLQVFIQDRVISRVLAGGIKSGAPGAVTTDAGRAAGSRADSGAPGAVTTDAGRAAGSRAESGAPRAVRAGSGRLPVPARLLARWPVLRRIPARVIGMGLRPEHVRTPAHSADLGPVYPR